jgi:hypothetical protein
MLLTLRGIKVASMAGALHKKGYCNYTVAFKVVTACNCIKTSAFDLSFHQFHGERLLFQPRCIATTLVL